MKTEYDKFISLPYIHERKLVCKAYNITLLCRWGDYPIKQKGIYKDVQDMIYVFSAKYKNNINAEEFTFYTGKPSGDDFAKILGIKQLPPISNFFISESPKNNTKSNSIRNDVKKPTLSELRNIELLKLLELFFVSTSFDPTKPSFKIYLNILKNMNFFSFQNFIKIDSILKKFNLNFSQLKINLEASAKELEKTIKPLEFCELIELINSPPKDHEYLSSISIFK